jgi:large subunit ribosomal protein L18
MKKLKLQKKRRIRRKYIIRENIFGTAEKPRLSVFKSNKFIYVQAIDDDKGITLASASSLKEKRLNIKSAAKVGEELAKKLKEKKIDKAVFDRNGFVYAGRLKALADGARKAGVKF